jgi:hypothetical protein
MISDTLAEADDDILYYFKEFSDCYGDDTPLRARMEVILALMRYVRLDLDSPEGPGIKEFPVVASIRASRAEIDSELLPIAEKIRGIFGAHGVKFDVSPDDDTQDA